MASKKEEDNEIGAFLLQHLALLKKGYSFSGYERDKVWLQRNGSFIDISGVSGADSISDGRAAIFWDPDNDGDTDILLRAMHGPATFFFENKIGQQNATLRVSLEGTTSGRDAFGSVVRVKSAAGIQTKVKHGGGRYCAQSDPRMLFATRGDIEWVEITWPNGRKQRVVPTSSSIRVVENR